MSKINRNRGTKLLEVTRNDLTFYRSQPTNTRQHKTQKKYVFQGQGIEF